MRNLFVVIIFVFFSKFMYSQIGLSNHWLLGYQSAAGWPGGISHFDFFTGNSNLYYDSIGMSFNHTQATIADSAGNLLFYTNGYYIADATGDTMQNGSGLNPGAYSQQLSDGLLLPQGALIIPMPGDSNKYYVFHNTLDLFGIGSNATIWSYSMNLFATTIDMTLNNGLGAVEQGKKNEIVFTDSMCNAKIAGCKHGNGRDWWVVVHQVNTDLYYKFLVTPYGIDGPFMQHIGGIHRRADGQQKFSPDGTKFSYYFWWDQLEIFDFDRCTGLFSNPVIHVPDTQAIGGSNGLEFSPNSQVLYVTNGKYVYQYDLTASNIQASEQTVAVWDTFVSPVTGLVLSIRLPQIAPDGKIYITCGNAGEYMHVINNPDVIGLGCNLLQHSLLMPSIYFNTVPNHPNYFLGANGLCNNLGLPNLASGETKKIQAFGNPTRDKFTLWFPVDKDVGWLHIYDINGACIRTERVAQWSQYKTVDIAEFSDGIYLVKMIWPDGEGSVKVVRLE